MDCISMYAPDTMRMHIEPYKIFECDGVRIAVLGLLQLGSNGLPDSHPKNLKNIRFRSPFEVAQEYSWLRDCCDVFIVLSHETLTATIAPSNATNKSVSWSSDKSDVATVDANGSVSSLKVGEANITVTTVDGSKTASCKVTVTEVPVAVTGIALNKTEMKLGVGGVDTLKVTFTPANATNKKVTWQINDATIAKVEDGVITALKAGEATITATSDDGSKTATW